MKYSSDGIWDKGRFYKNPIYLWIEKENTIVLRDEDYNKYPHDIAIEIIKPIIDYVNENCYNPISMGFYKIIID